ncbi:MAG: NPCBM/NEW2 domain-containing protein [Sporocytophaga sp.]|uniref:NPCBM/NEW2 domain-containing protein n=1 Tax=Sporocytophaga sp. TaxID=2231183 RepID=UPI001B0BE974|nr:NPCBM/NEW2 domain-containing protein [Sporocytophaga sp.]MBO9703473.1 NPCBM/NEW2 domain-containing protein [Sporocytophaga sp.]
MKNRSILMLNIMLLVPGLLFAQVGPGLGNLSYTDNELYKSIWKYTELNHMGSTMSTMHNGYMITTFHPDSGKPPGGILVWDVSNPRKPVVVTRIYDSRTANFRENHAMPQHGKYLLFQDGYGFQIWDFSDPKNPQQIKRHIMSGYAHDDYGSCWQLFWQAPYIFIANGSKGFDVVDATDLNNPVLVKHINTPRQVGPIFAIGNLLYTSAHDFGRGFTIYDISNPRDPKLLNSYSNTENMYASMVNGNKITISARGNSNNAIFGTYDISDPLNIKKITTLNIGNSGEQLYNSVQDHFIFQGCQSEVVKVDASNPSQLKILGRGSLGINGDSDHGQVTPFGNLIFVGNDHGSGSGFWVHQKEPDTKGPEVNMIVPKANDVNRALTSRVGLTFTDNIILESVNKNTFVVRPLGGAALSGKYSHQFSMVNFSPDQPLLPNTTYEIVIPAGGIKDYAGNSVSKTFTSYFSTGPSGDFPPASTELPWVFEDDRKITLNWNRTPNASSYIVKRSNSPSGPFQTIGSTNQLFFTDSKVENDRTYYYSVTASNSFGEGVASPVTKGMPSLYITNLNWTSVSNGWGQAEKDQSNGEEGANDGNVITLDGIEYSRGLGVHAQSTITYKLDGKYERFLSDIGVDDEVGSSGSVIFTVLLDGKQIYTSGLMNGSSSSKSIDVNVAGGNLLTLTVSPDGDNGLDHGSWGGARLRPVQSPFNQSAHAIPGRIEAEEYDFGGEGIAYHEANANGNEGGSSLRIDEVDIEGTKDSDGLYNIGYVLQGEWLEYTVNVTSTGVYNLDMRVAADGDGKIFHIEFDGKDITGPINVPNTGGWQSWEIITLNGISLTEGNHIMRLAFDASFMNLNYLQFNGVITGITDNRTSDITIYPNPFMGNDLKIITEGNFKYRITDIWGFELETGNESQTQSIGKELKPGVYILSVENKNGVMVRKIVKE